MKKFAALLVAVLFAFSATYAVDPNTTFDPNYGAADLNTSGIGSQDWGKTNDLSYDEQTSQYCIYVICELTISPVTQEYQDLGYINPDGARDLTNATMKWLVNGAPGWYVEIDLKHDVFATYDNGPTGNGSGDKTVYFVDPYWTVGNETTQYSGDPSTGDYEMEKHLSGFRLEHAGCQDCDDFDMKDCDGILALVFHPNKVVASDFALTGTYKWDLFVSADYLTWVQPVKIADANWNATP